MYDALVQIKVPNAVALALVESLETEFTETLLNVPNAEVEARLQALETKLTAALLALPSNVVETPIDE